MTVAFIHYFIRTVTFIHYFITFFPPHKCFTREDPKPKVTKMPPKDESVVKESRKRKIPELVWNQKTNRYVKKDGAAGKQIE